MDGEKYLSLTTPELPNDRDTVFPGENWFFYWKSSPSLWESKLQFYSKNEIVIVPINWGFHSDDGESFDFAKRRPETDLKRLVDCAQKLGLQITFLLPITPAPFLVNGGVPSGLSRVISLDENLLAYSVLNSENFFSKLYSFFDPRIFKSFVNFTQSLGEYFSKEGIACPLWAINCGYLNRGQFRSFILDRSNAFSSAFSRFVAQNRPEGEKIGQEEEIVFRKSFEEEVLNLYQDGVKEGVAGNFEGTRKVSFIGASRDSFIDKLFDNESKKFYSNEALQAVCVDSIPSSTLVAPIFKRGIFLNQLNTIIDSNFIKSFYAADFYEEANPTILDHLIFFEIYESEKSSKIWENLGTLSILKNRYSWCYKFLEAKDFIFSKDSLDLNIIFIQGIDIGEREFKNLLKYFMSGGKIILDRSNMDPLYLRKLEGFFLENSIELEKINFITDVSYAALGEGGVLIFNGEKLDEKRKSDQEEFWTRVLKVYEIIHPEIRADEGVNYFWKKRDTSPDELNYEEVRRISLFNPTSYKRKVDIKLPSSLALAKILDEVNTKIVTSPHLVEIELMPSGSISIDFGVFDEQ